MNSRIDFKQSTVDPLEKPHVLSRPADLPLLGTDLLRGLHLNVMHVVLDLRELRVLHCLELGQEVIEEARLPRDLLHLCQEVVKDLFMLGGGEGQVMKNSTFELKLALRNQFSLGIVGFEVLLSRSSLSLALEKFRLPHSLDCSFRSDIVVSLFQ